jgi:ribonuclease P protein component
MDRLKRRADFLAAAAGLRAQAGPFLLQARDRRDRGTPRVGFTVTKKTGNSVERNRIRRRLRAAVKAIVPQAGHSGFDYVLVARRPALTAPFAALTAELTRALERVHAARHRKGSARAGDGDSDGR